VVGYACNSGLTVTVLNHNLLTYLRRTLVIIMLHRWLKVMLE
jgi:hypothetical protein